MKKNKRDLIIFITVTLASGWLGVLLDMILSDQPEGNTLGMGLWLVLPLLTALILSIVSRDWKDAGLTPRFKGNIKWYLLSLAIFPGITVIILLLAKVFGAVDLSKIEINKILPVIVGSLIINFVKNIFEEFAWRGYLTPKLIKLTRNDWLIYLISGLVWAMWHVPYYLVFIDGSFFESLSISRVAFIFIATFAMLCWNTLYVEMFRRTKSVWPCALMHAAEDAVPAFLLLGGYYVFTSNKATWIFDPHIGILAALMPLAIGLLLRHLRVAPR